MTRCFSAPCRSTVSFRVSQHCCGRSLVICGGSTSSLDGSPFHSIYNPSPSRLLWPLPYKQQKRGMRRFSRRAVWQLFPELIFLHRCVFHLFSSFGDTRWVFISLGGRFISVPDGRAQALVSRSTLASGFAGKHRAAFVLLCSFVSVF